MNDGDSADDSEADDSEEDTSEEDIEKESSGEFESGADNSKDIDEKSEKDVAQEAVRAVLNCILSWA